MARLYTKEEVFKCMLYYSSEYGLEYSFRAALGLSTEDMETVLKGSLATTDEVSKALWDSLQEVLNK